MKKGFIFATTLAMVLGVGVAVGAHQAQAKPADRRDHPRKRRDHSGRFGFHPGRRFGHRRDDQHRIYRY